MPSYRLADLKPLRLIDGVEARIATANDLMLSYVEFAEGTDVPEHSHPNLQAGLVISGRIRFVIDGQEHLLGAGDFFFIPANAPHSAAPVGGSAIALDIFSPPRADYASGKNDAFGE